MNSGFKISIPGVDVQTAAIKDLVVDSNYPFAKCDLRKSPKNYGLINFLIGSLGTGASITIYQQPHGYNYIPSFLTAWSFPPGTTPSNPSSNTTFGIGDIDCSLGSGLYISMYVDSANLYITATNSGGSPVGGSNGTIRFYIFADDFSDT